MRILAGFLSATEGTARMAGHDVSAESEEVRRRVGFMPENNPLHEDMRVREYLKFRARLKGLNREKSRDRVGDVMEQLSLTDVKHRMIGALSKGYRQRVGLADDGDGFGGATYPIRVGIVDHDPMLQALWNKETVVLIVVSQRVWLQIIQRLAWSR